MNLERSWTSRALATLAATAGLAILTLCLTGTAASAATVCDPGGDNCAIVPDTVQTPLGIVTVTISSTNVATVQLTPIISKVRVFGVPFGYPAAPSSISGYARTSISTTAGLINIDTILIPPGRFSPTNISIISIIPPGPPCRATTTGTTVVFTPITAP